ncbi:TIGR02646 family protein [Marinilabiliaceae bacterium JC040]|nr:TIGR02646 family protein [Marinilabiliaceae bacterium JC040]
MMMILIKKNKEPQEWKKYRETEGAEYQSQPYLRKALYDEQGGICAYCMKKLDDESSNNAQNRIEHIKPRSKYKELELDYSNMVLCCDGHNGNIFSCDLAKGDELISFTPLDSRFIDTISYGSKDGVIRSSNEEWNYEINKIVRLNEGYLLDNRRAALMGFIKTIKEKNWKRSNLKNLYDMYSKKVNGKYQPYCGIILYFLKKKINR